MARITIILKNGREADFDTASFKVRTSKDANGNPRITELEYFKKDNGVSLLFVDYSEIAAITRDTTKDAE